VKDNILELGKEVCEALICGDWRYIPVEILRHYEHRDKVLYRCHICHHHIVLMREGKDPAHFEHRPGNPECLLSYHKLDPNKDRSSLSIVSATSEQLSASYVHEVLLQFTTIITGPFSLISDIDDLKNSSVKKTLRKQLIDARCGQGKFRKSLIEHWGECAVSGADKIELLIASHIKPWSVCNNQERLDMFNGILLSPNLDKAFDYGLISFNDDGTILISREFNCYEDFNIDNESTIKLQENHKPYLQYHREVVFKA